jgi:hypothetical protein
VESLLDALGYVGDSLNKPGRAVRGLLGGRPDELAAAVPFSDSLGLTDPAREVRGSDLLRQLGAGTGSDLGDSALGLGVDVATDPLTYLGVGLGRRLGGAATKAAAAAGPGFETTAADVARLVGESGSADAAALLRQLAGHGDAALERAAGELAPGSSFLGAGKEGLAFRTPGDEVLRIGQVPAGTPGRPVAESMLQADRAVDVPVHPPRGRPADDAAPRRGPGAAGRAAADGREGRRPGVSGGAATRTRS